MSRPADGRWVVLDVGETLIDETRVWSIWADVLGIPRLTFLAGLGAVVERGQEHREVFALFGVTDWRARVDEVEAAYDGFRADDLYPDALPLFATLRAAGYRTAVIANQPAARTAELRRLGVDAEAMAMSDELGVWKPDPAFFARTLELLGAPAAADVAYVGDRVDNDVLPSAAAGMRAVWIRRGPWGVIQRLPASGNETGDGRTAPGVLVVDTLRELGERIGEAWRSASAPEPDEAGQMR
ncbi:MAG: haloacid dehalogenase [Chloroflexi bacterium]|nr:MAG: haloacid dehalogenase [Chloroflexota bacterium]